MIKIPAVRMDGGAQPKAKKENAADASAAFSFGLYHHHNTTIISQKIGLVKRNIVKNTIIYCLYKK